MGQEVLKHVSAGTLGDYARILGLTPGEDRWPYSWHPDLDPVDAYELLWITLPERYPAVVVSSIRTA